jgi:hypothetical protein
MHRRFAHGILGPALLALAFASAGTGSAFAAGGEVRVNALVGSVAVASGPGSISLEPGESRTVTVRVAANIPWRLAIATDNPAIRIVANETTGRRGGFAAPGNTVQIEFLCDPWAPEKQVGVVEYSLVRK